MSEELILPVKLNNFAAGLTVIEFFIGSVAIACVPLLFLGIWIIKLRRALSLTIVADKKWYRHYASKIVVLVLGVLLTSFVAIVETKSEETVDITNNTVNASLCAVMNNTYEPLSSREVFPYRFELDDITLRLQQKMFCPNGIQALDFGSPKGNQTSQLYTLQPKCNLRNESSGLLLALRESSLLFESQLCDQTNVYPRGKNQSYIIPYVVRGFNVSIVDRLSDSFRSRPNIIRECKEKNISSIPNGPIDFSTRGISERELFTSVLWHVCQNHNTSSPQLLAENPLQKLQYIVDIGNSYCSFQTVYGIAIETYCLYTEVQRDYPEYLFSVDLKDVSTLTTKDKRHYVCMNATVRYEYILIPKASIGGAKYDEDGNIYDNENVVIPLRVEVLQDEYVHCEITVPSLGFQALILSARDEWRVNVNMSADEEVEAVLKLSRVERYQAYAISLARRTFYYDRIALSVLIQDKGDKCSLKEIGVATAIKKDWSFVILLVLASVCGFIIVVALLFKVSLPTKYWDIGEYAKNLRFLKRKPELLEIIREMRKSEEVEELCKESYDYVNSDIYVQVGNETLIPSL